MSDDRDEPDAPTAGRDAPAERANAMEPDKAAPSIRESLREYLDRRLLIIFIFGIASGFPWVLWGSAMTAWLKESGLTRSAIGVFGTVAAAYSTHFLWAPFVDRIPFPLLGRLGQRRGWLLGHADPARPRHPRPSPSRIPRRACKWTGILALVIAFCSATQDIAISAYRIEIIPREETTKISHASAAETAGWWTGYALLGAVPFFLADLPGLDLEPDLHAAGRHVDPDHDRGDPRPRGQAAPRSASRKRRRSTRRRWPRRSPPACGRASRPGSR